MSVRRHQADDRFSFDEVRAVVGEEAAANLSRDLGGRQVYVPREPGPAHPLTVSMGAEASAALGLAFGGQRIDVSLLPAKRSRILALKAEGWKTWRIARDLRCTERHVYQVLADAAKSKGSATGDLFA